MSTSSYAAAAHLVSVDIQRQMRLLNLNTTTAATLAGISRRCMQDYVSGQALPTLHRAGLLQESFGGRVLQIVTKARTFTCQHCGTKTVAQGKQDKVWCSVTCRRIGYKLNNGRSPIPNRRQEIPALADAAILRSCVALFCAECEPGGLCHQPECALRPVSPISLAERMIS